MKVFTRTTEITLYRSEILDWVETEDAALSHSIAWADALPVVYKILNEKRSVFGKDSYQWISEAMGETAHALLRRVALFRAQLKSSAPFFNYLANFTLENYENPSLRKGFMQQWDGTYTRFCTSVDYTPDTLDAVIQRFRAWCDEEPRLAFYTQEIWLDRKPVWSGCEHPSKTRQMSGEFKCDLCGLVR